MNANFDVAFVEEMWQVIAAEGYRVRKSKEDGLQAWNRSKQRLLDLTQGVDWELEWMPKAHNYYAELKQLGLRGDDNDDKSDERWEREHFVLQLGRIVHKNPNGSFVRLMQIAYNIGQADAVIEMKSDSYSEDISKFFCDHSNIRCFVNL